MTLSMQDADAAASRAEALIRDNRLEEACLLLDPLALGRTKFPTLDRVGARLGQANVRTVILLEALDRMVSRRAVGYYVIVGSALAQLLRSNMATCLEKTAEYIMIGDSWDKCDAIAERAWGRALVEDFPRAYEYMAKMVKHENRWIRRGVGVAVHYYAKKRRTAVAQMRRLLLLLAPALGERNHDAAKGIGWGLKTIGRHQPKLLIAYLRTQMRRAHPTKLLLRKAATYLPARAKKEFIGRSIAK